MEKIQKIGALVLFSSVLMLMLMSFASSGIFDWFKGKGLTGRATISSVTVNITVSSPFISFISTIPAQDPLENGNRTIYVNFTAHNSSVPITDASALMNFSRSGETTRVNTTCTLQGRNNATSSNYTCTMYLWYFDQNGAWTIGAYINDSNNATAVNTSATFTYNQLSAFVSAPASITFPAISPGITNTTSNNDPSLMNNTGNKDITAGNIDLNATQLVGESDSTKVINTRNMTVGVLTGSNAECGVTNVTYNATVLQRAVFTVLNQSVLGRGNYSLNNGTQGQEQLYLCILLAGTELTSQPYSTSSQGAWTLRIN